MDQINYLKQTLNEKEQQMTEIQSQLAASTQFAVNEQSIAFHKSVILEKDLSLAEKNSLIDSNAQSIKQMDLQLKEKDLQLQEKDRILIEKDHQLAEKDRLLIEKDLQLKEKDRLLIEKDHQLAQITMNIKSVAPTLSPSPSPSPQIQNISSPNPLKKCGEIRREIEKNEFHKKEEIIISKISKTIGNNINLLTVKQQLGNGCEGIVFLTSLNDNINNNISDQNNINNQNNNDQSNNNLNNNNDSKETKELAVKVLYNMGLETSNVIHRFENEFKVLWQLQSESRYHPNLIRIYHHFQSKPSDHFFDHFPDVIKEYAVHINGEKRSTLMLIMPHHRSNLCDLFRSNNHSFYLSLSLFDKLLFCFDILKAIKFLFKHHIIHRDLKLNNLLLSNDGHVIVCDFGYAIRVDQNDYSILLERGSPIGGNLIHLAPEIRSVGVSLNSRNVLVDYSKQPTWEFALLSYEILFGLLPDHLNLPSNRSSPSLSSEIVTKEMILEHARGANMGGRFGLLLADLLLPMLRVNPADRSSFPDAYSSFLSFLSTHFNF